MTEKKRQRMSRLERREQLIGIARALFAGHGYDAVSIEEIAANAGVSKPVIYEHFGGKEGLYQVIVDRETQAVGALLADSLGPDIAPRAALERAIYGLFDYIDANPDGFSLLIHQSPNARDGAGFSTILSDIGDYLTSLLTPYFTQLGLNDDAAPLYAQMLAGLVGLTGQRWASVREPGKRELAAHVVNLIWNGLHALEREPRLGTIE
ncbi:AcrR family transcriptional regulator [Arcanobacterium wilhelmae]|uniref:AcrR family transcriptional regulator n=1 Tax=Arcanobacterium wilhelmae TaxID=1803177 RepID=A0ABT9NBX7_9ACTO|nr:TetR/AcrR family transcriptional regulator [Arcanobacterium wilhelmae]MDP9801215.1 AcrR family transcriptional regulator [Arcanobacterium wilhelmae]WFN90565.1 TetR/AcrR family transcriptional regulator [Arcanobacterium wilhelmae]